MTAMTARVGIFRTAGMVAAVCRASCRWDNEITARVFTPDEASTLELGTGVSVLVCVRTAPTGPDPTG